MCQQEALAPVEPEQIPVPILIARWKVGERYLSPEQESGLDPANGLVLACCDWGKSSRAVVVFAIRGRRQSLAYETTQTMSAQSRRRARDALCGPYEARSHRCDLQRNR